MFHEDELLPISALQHLIFCERQCALIHVEKLWAENRLTVEGKHLHERSDKPGHVARHHVRVARALPLRSLMLGIVGQADVVEFHSDPLNPANTNIVPVEYKRGQPKKDDSDRVQLCAQALCLEEMCDTDVTEGALYYGKRRRHTTVSFDEPLRSRTIRSIQRLREMIDAQETPAAVKLPKCQSCSLIEFCMPGATAASRSASRFMSRQLAHHAVANGPESDAIDHTAD